MVAVLQPLGDAGYIAIDRAVVLVGRSAECDAVISSSAKISRRHCCLVQVDDQYYVRDLGSMNGVWVNGNRVDRECRIQAGDKVAVGDVEFLFHPNARVEKKASPQLAPQPEPVPPHAAPADPPEKIDDRSAEQTIDASEDQFDLVEDLVVIEDDDEIWETNELEVIDEPMIEDDVIIDDDDDIFALEDD